MIADGVLGLIKPPGCSSHDAVALVRRKMGRPAGHLGTLDPLAAGVLVVAYGEATRLIRYAEGMDKEYVAEIWLGRRSPSDDFATPLTDGGDASCLLREDVEKALLDHLGTRPQRPPAYSARQVDGQRAYRAARAGSALDLPARAATLHDFSIQGFDAGSPARLRLKLRVAAGFYVRSLARDLGEGLGTGGVLAALVRTRAGDLRAEDCQAFEEPWQPQSLQALVAHLPEVRVSEEDARRIAHGQRIAGAHGAGPHRAICGQRLVGIVIGDADIWRPQTVLKVED